MEIKDVISTVPKMYIRSSYEQLKNKFGLCINSVIPVQTVQG